MADRPVDERSPLIERTDEDSEAVREVEEGAVPPTPVPEKKRTWWQIMWNIVLALLAIFVAVVFIKGFIDADDIEVSIYCLILGASGLVQRRRRNGQRHTSGNRVVIRALCMVLDGTLDLWNPPLL